MVVVDDGSDPPVGARIRDLCTRFADAEYLRHPFNGGKGFAVMCGIARAGEREFTHAVQVDADGQHDLSSLDALLAMSRCNPTAIVSGVPKFDQRIPMSRRIWRPFTNFWVAVNSVSLRMPDAMCGFRVYPVDAVLNLVRRSVPARRMDFDVEILVKAHWAGIPIAGVPVRVSYPKENFSNFNVLRDNVLLSALQTRLFFGMLLRLPWLAVRPRAKLLQPGAQSAPWASLEERGAYWGMRILAGIYRVLGRHVCLVVMFPIVLYFFATGRQQRRASREYLLQLWQSGHLPKPPTLWMSVRHFMSFSVSALDKLAAWTGSVPRSTLQGEAMALLSEVEASGRGAFVITAHVGNTEVIRAVASLSGRVPINVLMHTDHARLFNRLIREFSPNSTVRAFPVNKIEISTAIAISEAVARGEWVVMTGDRVPVGGDGRVIDVPFLGRMASFPQGPYILASVLKVPVFLLFCVRKGRGFYVHFQRFAEMIELPRADRVAAIRRYAARFAQALEVRVADTPLQWFNFYPFWGAAPDGPHGDTAAAKAQAQ